jgi:hypothetical protein
MLDLAGWGQFSRSKGAVLHYRNQAAIAERLQLAEQHCRRNPLGSIPDSDAECYLDSSDHLAVERTTKVDQQELQ